MALERVLGIHSAPCPAASTQGGLSATGTSASGETSRDKTHAGEEIGVFIDQAAQHHHLNAALLSAVVHVESGGNPQAVSPAGAQGLTQLIPATAQRFPESRIRLSSPEPQRCGQVSAGVTGAVWG